MWKKKDVCGRFGSKLWSTGKEGRPLGCNYPYECVDGEWTGPVWGSDNDQGDNFKKKKKRRETDGRRLTDKEDRTPPPPPSATKTSQADTGQGQRLLVNTQHAGDKKALT